MITLNLELVLEIFRNFRHMSKGSVSAVMSYSCILVFAHSNISEYESDVMLGARICRKITAVPPRLYQGSITGALVNLPQLDQICLLPQRRVLKG